MRVRKTTHHLRFVAACVSARKALSAAAKLVDIRNEDDGTPLTEEELRGKAASAIAWIGKAKEELTIAEVRLAKELEHRTFEADPDTIQKRQLALEVERLRRQKQHRWDNDELKTEVLRLRREAGMVPAAIADTLKVSELRVKQILRDAA